MIAWDKPITMLYPPLGCVIRVRAPESSTASPLLTKNLLDTHLLAVVYHALSGKGLFFIPK